MREALRTVIIVDDDAAVRRSLKFVLETEGLAVCAYEDGLCLLAEENVPPAGCIVVDYYMPILDGLELVAALRRRAIETPAILITAQANEVMRQEALRAGVQLVLEKPIEDSSLIDSIHMALKPQ